MTSRNLFPSTSSVINILRKSKFFYSLNDINLRVRGYSSHQDFFQGYISNLIPFSREQREELRRIDQDVGDRIFGRKIDVVYAMSNHNEEGQYHTLENIIFLSPSFFSLPAHRKQKGYFT